jgi:23S rRNA pseudouridine1911/1915/1917 synthase
VRPAYRLKAGDEIDVEPIFSPSLTMQPEEIPLHVVYEDRDLAVIDKPAGLVVHPAAGHESGTLANALLARFPAVQEVGQEMRPGIVHRLDKDTSGLIAVALNPAAQTSLQRQIGEREAERRYLALATGKVEPATGTIEAPIGRDPVNRKRMAVHGMAARPARTSYHVMEYLDGFSLLDVRLHTGRTHQIRVHLAAMGHSIAGDRTYHGATYPGLDRQFLHAYRLTVRSPSTGEELEFRSPLPADLQTVLDSLRTERSED